MRGKKQKWEAFLDESFPFNDLKTLVLNSFQATVYMAFPSYPSQNRQFAEAPKSVCPNFQIPFCTSAVALLRPSLLKAPSCPIS
jgi:hypothetical protein